jgi:fructosamine-3-kinase
MPASDQHMNVQEELLRQIIDPTLTKENLSVLATQALGVRIRCEGYTVLTGGCWNRVIAVATNGGRQHLVFKITPQPGDAALQREFAVLRYFRAHTAMPVPQPYLLDLSGERVAGSVLVMEMLPGTVLHAVYDQMDTGARASIATQMAQQLVDLHTRREPGFGGVEVPPEQRASTWCEFWLPRYEATLAEAQAGGTAPDALLDALQDLRPHLPELLAIGPVGTLTHYDIWTGNVMVALDGAYPRVTGYLDVMGHYADYARELSSMFGLADQRLMHIYEQRHGFDATFEARFTLYTLKMCMQLVHMYPGNPDHLANTRRHLRTLQRYFGVTPEH